MNRLIGHIEDVQVSGNLSLVSVRVADDQTLKGIVVEDSGESDYLAVGNSVRLLFKETEVVLGLRADLPVSLQNRIPGRIRSIENGELLCRVSVQSNLGEIVSIISANAAQQLNLAEGTEVTAMVKLNEILFSKP